MSRPLHPHGLVRLPAWKRALDLTGCLLALPVLAACAGAMALLTRLVSPGPVLFRQERVGLHGRRFWLYKFRTMIVGADSAGHRSHFQDLVRSNAPMEKLDARGDTRLIPGAWFLRATGLDELPQIINVLRGEMSLVGPRPCLPSEYALCRRQQRRRLATPPGLTGLWQVSGKNRTTFAEMVRLDVAYAERRSWWLDLKIIALTPAVLLRQVRESRAARDAVKRAAAGPTFALPEA